MEDNAQSRKLERDQMRYKRLDRFLLYLLAVELGYFIFLMLGAVVVAALAFSNNFAPGFYRSPTGILWPVLFYILALPFNLSGALASIVLNIRTKHQGYPGTGHLLNWIFLMTTAWLFIVALVFLAPDMARRY